MKLIWPGQSVQNVGTFSQHICRLCLVGIFPSRRGKAYSWRDLMRFLLFPCSITFVCLLSELLLLCIFDLSFHSPLVNENLLSGLLIWMSSGKKTFPLCQWNSQKFHLCDGFPFLVSLFLVAWDWFILSTLWRKGLLFQCYFQNST